MAALQQACSKGGGHVGLHRVLAGQAARPRGRMVVGAQGFSLQVSQTVSNLVRRGPRGFLAGSLDLNTNYVRRTGRLVVNIQVPRRPVTSLKPSVYTDGTEHPEGSASQRPQQHSKGAPFSRRLLLGAACVGLGVVAVHSSASATNLGWLLGDVAGAVHSSPEGSVGAADLSGPASPGKAGNSSRAYDATVLGEPVALARKDGVFKKLASSRVVYLGESERVPDLTDGELELEIITKLRNTCVAEDRPVNAAFQCFPRPMQSSLDLWLAGGLTDDQLRFLAPHVPAERFDMYLPILHYCRDNSVRIIAAGVPPEVLLKVQAHGLEALSADERRRYAPPSGGGLPVPVNMGGEYLAGGSAATTSSAFGPGPYRFAQARAVTDYSMAAAIADALTATGTVGVTTGTVGVTGTAGVIVAITGASHVLYGSRGRGVPVRVAGKLKRQGQSVVMLNPERQYSRAEGDVPEADFLWYSATKACTRNCFDRAEVARVMGAAGRTREKLPSDLQAGLDLGLLSPATLQDFFDLDKYPIVAAAADRFEGLRARWLADPRFLQRLALEESISITTALLAQYERRRERFWSELEYVITDVFRGVVVNFFAMWLPAPTLSFRSLDQSAPAAAGLQALLGSLPDNAFQVAASGMSWGLGQRVLTVGVAGVKLFLVGVVASVGTAGVTQAINGVREQLDPLLAQRSVVKRPPVLKTAVVYAGFLATSSNLRYQAISGLVEHWGADVLLADWPLLGSCLSFVARTFNSFWGVQQWIDLARLTGLQGHKFSSPNLVQGSSQQPLLPELLPARQKLLPAPAAPADWPPPHAEGPILEVECTVLACKMVPAVELECRALACNMVPAVEAQCLALDCNIAQAAEPDQQDKALICEGTR